MRPQAVISSRWTHMSCSCTYYSADSQHFIGISNPLRFSSTNSGSSLLLCCQHGSMAYYHAVLQALCWARRAQPDAVHYPLMVTYAACTTLSPTLAKCVCAGPPASP